MKLDLTSLQFNSNILSSPATPSWGTSVGQSSPDYPITVEGAINIIEGIINNYKPDITITGVRNNPYVIVKGVFNNVSVITKEKEINLDNKLILAILEESTGTHQGRRTLKYNRHFSYGDTSNEDLYNEITLKLTGTDEGTWFATDFIYKPYPYNKIEIHAYKVSDTPMAYATPTERKDEWVQLIGEKSEIQESGIITHESRINYEELKNTPRQKIIYGAPGTGKSFDLQEQVDKLGFTKENTKRVTFHPNYSYQQFVGTYKPTPIYKDIEDSAKLFDSTKKYELAGDNKKEPIIDYTFVPGPFLTLLVEAMKEENKEKPFMLIIEEINRASVASVFGDIFQLLDRDKNNISEYEIEFNADVSNYLKSEGIKDQAIRIPSNLFIWATMNSADQGVMPLDSAFKRRWSFEYLELDKKEVEVSTWTVKFQDKIFFWNKFRKCLNEKLISLSVPEDKLIGPFFLKESELKDDNAIKNKLLIYLRDDVVRHNPEDLFKAKTFSEIIKLYDSNNDIFKELKLESAIFQQENQATESTESEEE